MRRRSLLIPPLKGEGGRREAAAGWGDPCSAVSFFAPHPPPPGEGFRKLRRRAFITALCGAAAWPLAARAQQAASRLTIGYLSGGTVATQGPWIAAFARRLGELGWIEGRDVVIERRLAEGHKERFAEFAAELVDRKADVIVTTGTPATAAVKRLTKKIPIVFVGSGDPVGIGLVASLARPGANITGLSNQHRDVAGKRLAFLRAVIPALRRLAILADADNPAGMLEVRDIKGFASELGLELTIPEVHQQQDISAAFAGLNDRADALYVLFGGLEITNQVEINTRALQARLATMHGDRGLVETGGLMAYGPHFVDLYRRAAELVAKILHGADPGSIPVEQPTKFEFVVNLKTAKALGLDIPPTLTALADEVIE
jgi:putative ABC transport system substrate-binding protein